MFDEILVDSNTLRHDYMGLIGAFGVHIPTSMIPRGNYRIREVYSRFMKLRYRCHNCGAISRFRGKTNQCLQCGIKRKTRRFRKFRKLKLAFAMRYLRRFVQFDYYRDSDWYSRCCICGTYLKGNYDEYPYGAGWCDRCDCSDWRTVTPLHKELSGRAKYELLFFLAFDDKRDNGHIKSLLDDCIGHEKDQKPVQEIPILEPYCKRLMWHHGNHNVGVGQLEDIIWRKELAQRAQEAVV